MVIRKEQLDEFIEYISVKERVYNAKGDGSTDDSAALISWNSACILANVHGYLPPGTYYVGSNVSLTCNVHFSPNAIIKPASGKTVTFSGAIFCNENSQHFDLSSGGSVILSSNLSKGNLAGGAYFDGYIRRIAILNSASNDSDDYFVFKAWNNK